MSYQAIKQILPLDLCAKSCVNAERRDESKCGKDDLERRDEFWVKVGPADHEDKFLSFDHIIVNNSIRFVKSDSIILIQLSEAEHVPCGILSAFLLCFVQLLLVLNCNIIDFL